MNNLQEFYRKIEYLRSNGVKMKEIADWIDMAPSILSSLYTTVLPNYFEGIKSYPPEEALDSALALVNNVSKKRLLSHIEEMILRLDQMEFAEPDSLKDNPFAKQLMEEIRLSASKIKESIPVTAFLPPRTASRWNPSYSPPRIIKSM